jgi:pimeloyl-ACP methyl ester carboxylesterase
MLTDIGITNDELKNIRTDVKIIYAEHDMIKEAHIKQLAALIPQSTLNKVNDCNHLTILNKKEVLAIIKSYLLENH